MPRMSKIWDGIATLSFRSIFEQYSHMTNLQSFQDWCQMTGSIFPNNPFNNFACSNSHLMENGFANYPKERIFFRPTMHCWSVRPLRWRLISAQADPCLWYRSAKRLSSASVHFSFLILGFTYTLMNFSGKAAFVADFYSPLWSSQKSRQILVPEKAPNGVLG